MAKKLEIVVSNDINEIRNLVSVGFCPVECSVGGESIVDSLNMDHHGEWSHLESVAVRAYRDHYGARVADPRFVIAGAADADATFAVASLAGLLPHPRREVSDKLPPPVRSSLTRDLSALAETVARVDVSPIGLDIPSLEGGDILLVWNAMSSSTSRTSMGGVQGVGLWVTLTEGDQRQLAPFLGAAKEAEAARRYASFEDLKRVGRDVDGVLILDGSRAFGFPEWYGRLEEKAPAEAVSGWRHPVVLARVERGSNVTMGCPNQEVAEAIFGSGGLKTVFPHLQPEGWGGREAVGGSPRGVELSSADLEAAARVVASLMKR